MGCLGREDGFPSLLLSCVPSASTTFCQDRHFIRGTGAFVLSKHKLGYVVKFATLAMEPLLGNLCLPLVLLCTRKETRAVE